MAVNRKNKETFNVLIDGEEKKFSVVRPSPPVIRDSQDVYNRTFGRAIKNGAPLRKSIDVVLREQGLWDDTKEEKRKNIIKEMNRLALELKKGGKKVSEGYDMAMDVRRQREDYRKLLMDRIELDINTAEGLSDQERFNYLMARCLVDDGGKPVYTDMDAYLEDAISDIAQQGAAKLADMMYGNDPDTEAELPENEFLKRFDFVDEEFRLIHEDGHLVDNEGKLINKDGRYVDKDDNLVDIDGNKVDEEGNWIEVEEQPWLDDDGNPVEVEAETTEE
jgi:hypothetical protein